MEFEISLKTSGIHDQATNMSRDVHSRITITLEVPGVVQIYDNEFVKESLMEILRIDSAIHNKLGADQIIEFKPIKNEL